MVDFEKVFNYLPDMYAIVNVDHPLHTIVAASDGYLLKTNKTREEIIGKPIFVAFSGSLLPADKMLVLESMGRCIDTKMVTSSPLVRYDIEKDGVKIETYWSGRTIPLINERGEVEYLLRCPINVTITK